VNFGRTTAPFLLLGLPFLVIGTSRSKGEITIVTRGISIGSRHPSPRPGVQDSSAQPPFRQGLDL